MSYPILSPECEASRLRALSALKLIDTPPEAAFDALATLAARLLDCPIGLVTLIERDRQWIKAAEGTDVTENTRRDAFCSHTIAGDGPLIINDMTVDARFAHNPLVTNAPSLRAYAGVPITARDPDGGAQVPVGAVCVLDIKPRSFSPAQRDLLAPLSALAEALLDARAHVGTATVMVQKEVADRLVAPHGSKTYGTLSVYFQLFARARPLFDVPRHAFRPPPNVESAVVAVDFSVEAPDVPFEVLQRVVKAAFGQRRKMFRNSVAPLFASVGRTMPERFETLRPEAVPPAEFVVLAQALGGQ